MANGDSLEREKSKIRRKILPSGEVIEFRQVEASGFVAGAFRTHEVSECPYTDDGVTPLGIGDVFSCQDEDCTRIVTSGFIHTCSMCGLLKCSLHIVAVRAEGRVFLVCKGCDEEARTPKWRKLLRKLFWRNP